MPRHIDHAQRRELIAEAAWRVIFRDGVGGASVRTVAGEAGMSAGSLRHIFASQSELMVFALQLVVERVTARVDALPGRPTALETVELVASQFLPLDQERRAEMAVYLALFSSANADNALRAPCDEAYRDLRLACHWMLGELDNGVDLAAGRDLDFEATRLHAVIDGLALHLIYEPPDADSGWAHDVLIGHIRSLQEPNQPT